jgi:putative nucleotidyltransferase with HDIG domain
MICKPTEAIENARQKLSGDLDAVLNLRPMPGIVLRINEACQNEQANLSEIIELIECEPTIVAKILSLVNSSIYGHSREITSISQAVVVLGFKNLSQLATSIASKQVFEQGEDGKEERQRIYEHCLGVAATARALSQESFEDVDDGTAFLAGLLHDIGKLFLIDVSANIFSILNSMQSDSSMVELEREWYGVNHTELGRRFAELNGLPHSIAETISTHHREHGTSVSDLTLVTILANNLAKSWGLGQPIPPDELPIERWIETSDPEVVEKLRSNAEEQFKTLKSLFLGA